MRQPTAERGTISKNHETTNAEENAENNENILSHARDIKQNDQRAISQIVSPVVV